VLVAQPYPVTSNPELASAPSPIVRWVSIDDLPQPVAAHSGLVYSTNPGVAGGADGHPYFIKGPQTGIIVAEAVGYELAARIGLPVPPWALCRIGEQDDVYFASQAQRTRSGVDQLIQAGLVVNPDFLGTCIAFDAWTSNRDRNVNNIVAEPVGGVRGSEVRLVAIDFEKADILRGVDRFTVTAHPPVAFRPTGDLARHFSGLAFPSGACRKIGAVSRDEIQSLFQSLQAALPGHNIAWIDSASDFLATRGRRIDQLVREVWDA
jgi:hypothetical protein